MTRSLVAFLAGLVLGMSSILWHLAYWVIIITLSGVIIHLWK